MRGKGKDGTTTPFDRTLHPRKQDFRIVVPGVSMFREVKEEGPGHSSLFGLSH